MKLRLVGIVAAAMLIATACIKLNMTIEVREDGTGRIEGISALNAGALEGFAEAFGSEEDLCAQFGADSGIETSDFDVVEAYDEDGFCGVQFSSEISAAEIDAAGIPGDDSGTLRREGDGWYFELPLDTEDFSTEGDLGDLSDFGIDVFEDAEFLIKVKLPGRQVDHNGDSIDDDGFVVWDVDLNNPPARLFLRTEPGETITGDSGGNAGLILGIVFLALIGLGIAAYFLMRRSDSAATAAPASVPGAGEWAAPATPPVDASSWGGADATPPLQGAADVPDAPSSDPTTASSATSPTPEEATGAPVWDAVRGAYVQWDPGTGRWMVYDDATKTWGPEG